MRGFGDGKRDHVGSKSELIALLSDEISLLTTVLRSSDHIVLLKLHHGISQSAAVCAR